MSSGSKGQLPGRPTCPRCGKVLDGYTEVAGKARRNAMKPGDYTICLYCGCPCEWSGTVHMELKGDALVLARVKYPAFMEAEMAVREFIAERKK